MKHILLATLLFATQAFAGLPPTTTKGQSGSKSTSFNFVTPHEQFTKTGGTTALIETGSNNLLQNPGFEAATVQGIGSSTTTTAVETGATNINTGARSLKASISAGSFLNSKSYTIPNGWYGKPGQMTCQIKSSLTFSSSSFLQIVQSSTAIASLSLEGLMPAAFQEIVINFTFPLSGSVNWSLFLGNTSGDFFLDDCYLGLTKTQSAVLTTSWAAYSPTFSAGFGTPTNVNIKWRQIGDSIQIRGSFNYGTVANSIGTMSLPAGLTINTAAISSTPYKESFGHGWRLVSGAGDLTVGTGSIDHAWIYNGTNNVVQIARGTSTLLFASETVSASIANTGDGETIELLTIPITQFANSVSVYSVNTTPVYGFYTHGDNCAQTITGQTSFADYPGDSSCTFTTLKAENLPCSSYQSGGNNGYGLICSFPKPGTYWVCASGTPYGSVETGHAHRLYDGTSTIATGSEISLATPTKNTMCGPWVITATGSQTIRWQSQASTGNNILQSQRAPANAVEWSIVDISQGITGPYFIGSVTSNTTGYERIERAVISDSSICSASPCTITSQSGSWLSSVTWSTTGKYILNIASGIFSSLPTCTITHSNTETSLDSGNTATSVAFSTWNSGGSAANVARINVICMGPK